MNSTKDKPDSDDIGCLQAIESMYAWLDGELDDSDAIAGLEHHLDHCRSCYSRTEMEKALSRRINESARSDTPKALQERLRKLMDDF